MQKSDTKHARAILSTVIYPTIASVDKHNNPWAAPQFMVYDPSAKEFYWCADEQSQHAHNLAYNPKAYIVAYDSMAAPGAGDGVYTEVITQLVTDGYEQDKAFAQLLKKHAGAPYWTISDIKTASSPIKLFKASVISAWVNKGREENGNFILYREPVTL